MKTNIKNQFLLPMLTAGFSLIFAASAQAQFQWANRIAGTTSWPEGEPDIGLALDTNNNCYMTGFFDGTNNFGGVTLTNQSAGGSDIFVAKYNATGALQWVQRAGGTSVNYGRGVGVDTNGNIYVTGGYQGPAKFGGVNLAATSGEQFFLAKYNSAGTVQWVQSSTGGNGDNNGIGLAVDNAGNTYALAIMDYSGTSITFGTKTVTAVKGGTTFTILVKYDNTGAAQWVQLFDTSQETYATKLAVDAAGNVYVRGTFYSDMTIESSSLTVSPGSAQNMFVAKFNSSGSLIWIQQPQGDVGEGGVAVDLAGNVFVSGYFDTNLVFGGGITLTNMANTNALFGDAFLAKYNNAGAIQWAQSAGGTNGGFYWDLSLDAQTNIYAGGFVGYNAAVAKYNPAGTLQWAVSASGTPASPVASGFGNCVVDSIGNCFLAGFYQGTASFGAAILQPQETWNFFLTEVAPYTFGPQIQSTPSANITYDSGTGSFQYTDAANSTDDSAKIPLTGTAATLITTSNNWTTSLSANISARSMTASVSQSPHVWMQLAIYYSNGSSTYLLTFSLQQENNTGGANNENFPNGFYGTGVTIRARINGNDDTTTPLGASQLIQGGSVLLLSGGTTASPATESIGAATGILTLNYNASLNTVTGYYNGTPIGCYSIASWGANLPLTLFVAGSSGEGIGASAGTATASSFSVNTLTITNPTIQFTASPTNGAPPLTVHFNSASVDNLGNAITSWDWNFGDGATTNVQNPSHIYTSVGIFTPALTATNNNGVAVIGTGPQIATMPVTSSTNFTFTTNNGSITITGYTGPAGAVNIPSTINGLPVTGIGAGAFEYGNLTSITIPSSVTSIGEDAFFVCGSLANVSIPYSVTNIAIGAFDYCTSLTNITVDASNPAYSSLSAVLFDKAQATLVQFPGGLGGSYTIPNSVSSIAGWAFAYSYGLDSVTIPNNVTNIGTEAFYYCLNLTNVTIGSGVTNIGAAAFYVCDSLNSITVDSNNPAFVVYAGVLFNKSKSVLILYPAAYGGPDYIIPGSVINIEIYAFYDCTSLIGITIPASVTSIGFEAFGGCTSLTGIIVNAGNPDFVSVAGILFNNVQNTLIQYPVGNTAQSYTVPSSVTTINSYAFEYCGSLTSVTIPASVTNIGGAAFWGCTKLNGVYFQGGAPVSDASVFDNDNSANAYYLPGTTGWGLTFYGIPTAQWFLPNPLILNNGPSFGVQTNRFGFTISWATNMSVVVQACTNLANPVWLPVATNTLTGGALYFSDPQWTNHPNRFYRVTTTTPVAIPAGMALIPAGPFTIGDTLDGEYDAIPANVYVSAFYMDTNLVSYSQWQSVYSYAVAHGYFFDQAASGKAANHPVTTVDWYDSVEWCNARSQQAGLTPVYYSDAALTQLVTNYDVDAVYANWSANGYRLPTEAEWEKAARGGLSGQRFPWGDTISESQANYTGNTNAYSYDFGPNGLNVLFDTGVPDTSPVGFFAPNGYGLFDMAGNVEEWCWDWYAAPPYPAGSPYLGGTDPRGPASSPFGWVVLRGGAYPDRADQERCANRENSGPYILFDNYYGFRCVRGH